jgi:hypothetical protein
MTGGGIGSGAGTAVADTLFAVVSSYPRGGVEVGGARSCKLSSVVQF